MDVQKAHRMARQEMEKWGLGDWTFRFDRAVIRFGRCAPSKKLITLSATMTCNNAEEEVLDCIRHEIAHALVGAKHYHDAVWQAKAREVGAKPDRCYNDDKSRNVAVVAKYIATCPVCKTVYHRQRLGKLAHFPSSCSTCSPGKFDRRFLLNWQTRNKTT